MIGQHRNQRAAMLRAALAAILVVCAPASSRATAQTTIEINDIAGNTYVTGGSGDNVFRITPNGDMTQIIDATGDGAGNTLNGVLDMTVDAAGNVVVTGTGSNTFRITPTGVITRIINTTNVGTGTSSDGVTVRSAGNANGCGVPPFAQQAKLTAADTTPGDLTEGFALDPTGFATATFEPGQVNVIPEPATLLPLACVLIGSFGRARSRRRVRR